MTWALKSSEEAKFAATSCFASLREIIDNRAHSTTLCSDVDDLDEDDQADDGRVQNSQIRKALNHSELEFGGLELERPSKRRAQKRSPGAIVQRIDERPRAQADNGQPSSSVRSQPEPTSVIVKTARKCAPTNATDVNSRIKARPNKLVPDALKSKDFTKKFPTYGSYAKYLSGPEEERHFIALHRDRPLDGVKAFFVGRDKSLSKALAINMDNLVRLGGCVHEAFMSIRDSTALSEITTHVIAYTPNLRFKDVLTLMGLEDEKELVGSQVAEGKNSGRQRDVWVVNLDWLVECCKSARQAEAKHLGHQRAKRLSEAGFLIEGAGDKQRRKSFAVRSRSDASVWRDELLADFAMPGDSQLSTPAAAGEAVAQPDYYQGLLSEQQAGCVNESPLSFEDIAIEIDMARNNIDALVDGDDSGPEEPEDQHLTRNSHNHHSPRTAPAYVLPSRRNDTVGSDDCPSGAEEENLASKEEVNRNKNWELRQRKWEEGVKYRCDASSTLGAAKEGPNEPVARIFDQLAAYYEKSKLPNAFWRVKGYRTAAGALRNTAWKVETFAQARKIHGIGEKSAVKLVEIVATGKSTQLENQTQQDHIQNIFTKIYGVGPSKAMDWINAGLRFLEDVGDSERFGVILTEPQKLGLKYYDDLNQRMPRKEVERYFSFIRTAAMGIDASLRVECMGSYRRGQPDCGDVDILLTRDTADGKDHSGLVQRLVEVLYAQGLIRHTLSNPEDWWALDAKWMGLLAVGNGPMRRIDILGVPFDELGAALIYFTGNEIFNRSLRLKARHMGYSLNQRGLFRDVYRDTKTKQKRTIGTRIASKTEQEIFDALGTKWRPPTERLP